MMAGASMTSAVAFVAGGVQDACDDACSICLENFCENDPATITTCKHEYHLQCILEWSQRSKECPMCWQPLTLKDPDSQTLLAASEQERLVHWQRSSPFHHRSERDATQLRFGDTFGDDSDLEDRIMQHLAAAAMGRAQQFARRGEALRFRPSPGGVIPQSPTSASDGGGLESSSDLGWNTSAYSHSELAQGQRSLDASSIENSSLRRLAMLEPVEESHQRISSLEPSVTESLKSRLVAASSKYRESLSKTTRGFRERLRVRNGAMAELGARAREVSAGVVRALERISLESPERGSNSATNSSVTGIDMQVGTTLVQSALPCVSDGSEEQDCASSSLGESVCICSVTTSSIPVSQSSSVEGNNCRDITPVKNC